MNTVGLTLPTWVLLTGLTTWVEAASTLTLEQPVHFLESDGNDVMVEAGTYEVDTLVGSRLRLNRQGGGRVLLDAQATTHSEELEDPLAVTVLGEDSDVVHIVPLLPNGQALDAPGSITGTRSRGTSSLLASTAQIRFAVTQQAPVVRDHRGQPESTSSSETYSLKSKCTSAHCSRSSDATRNIHSAANKPKPIRTTAPAGDCAGMTGPGTDALGQRPATVAPDDLLCRPHSKSDHDRECDQNAIQEFDHGTGYFSRP